MACATLFGDLRAQRRSECFGPAHHSDKYRHVHSGSGLGASGSGFSVRNVVANHSGLTLGS